MKRRLLCASLITVMGLSSVAAEVSPRAVLDLPPGSGNSRNSEGDFVILKDGRILFAYSKLKDRLLVAYCAERNLKHLRIMSVPLAWLP